jgi:hypothetical protein
MKAEFIRNIPVNVAKEFLAEEYEDMPYERKGTTIFKKTSNGFVKKGSSKTVAGAKDYMKALYAHSKDLKRKR